MVIKNAVSFYSSSSSSSSCRLVFEVYQKYVCGCWCTWTHKNGIRQRTELNWTLKFIIKYQYVHISLPGSDMCMWNAKAVFIGFCAGDEINLISLKKRDQSPGAIEAPLSLLSIHTVWLSGCVNSEKVFEKTLRKAEMTWLLTLSVKTIQV